jgi:hypothetical protein
MYKPPLANGKLCFFQFVTPNNAYISFRALVTTIIFSVFIYTSAMAQWQPVNSAASDNGNIYHSTGNVGIGATIPVVWFPARVLEIADTRPVLKLTSTISTGLSSIVFTNSAINSTSHFGEFHQNLFFDQATPSNSLLRFSSYPGGEILAMRADGYVGINNITPTQQLDVNGRLKFRAKGAHSAGAWYTGSDGTEALFVGQAGVASTDAFGIYHGGTWRFTLNQDGNIGIGIGVSAPSQKVDIAGRLKFRSSSPHTAGAWYTDNAGTESAFLGLVDLTTSSSLGICHGGTWRFVVDQNGKVGIGTINPDEKLTVKGKIHAEEVRVDLNVPAPDYVFQKDYNLLSLSDIEIYINQNKHLPEVPSAKEMEEHGLNLKEMNLLLLKKVEELTLHLIKANKSIMQLQQEVKDMQKH